MAVLQIIDVTEYQTLINSTPCVVKFTAKWCGPCKRIAPQYTLLAKEYDGIINFLEIDIEKSQGISDLENVESIPLILFYLNGIKRNELTILGASPQTINTNIRHFSDLIIPDILESVLQSGDFVEQDASSESVDLSNDSSESSSREERKTRGLILLPLDEKKDETPENLSDDYSPISWSDSEEESSKGSQASADSHNEYGEDVELSSSSSDDD